MLCEEETMSETTTEYNTLTARQDNLLSPLQPEAGITSQYLSFFSIEMGSKMANVSRQLRKLLWKETNS